MGYSLYVTRRRSWHDPSGPQIHSDEWRRLVEHDPELTPCPELGEHFAVWSGASRLDMPWIAWTDGNLESKNPDEALIGKLVDVAGALGARLVGEEGETYLAAGQVLPPRPPSLRERVAAYLANLRAALAPAAPAPKPPFGVGSRVRDAWGNSATVAAIDLRADGGMGRISVRHDDGRRAHYAAVAHPFEPEGPAA